MNRKRIARRLKTDKRSEQIICDVFATTAVIKSKSLGTLYLDETLLKRLSKIVAQAASIQESWILEQKKTKSAKVSNQPSFSDFEGTLEGLSIAGYGYDVKVGEAFEKLGLEKTTENILKVIELIGEDHFQEFLSQCIREDLKK